MQHKRHSQVALLLIIYLTYLILIYFAVQLSSGKLEKYEFGSRFRRIDPFDIWKYFVVTMSVVWGIFIMFRPRNQAIPPISLLGCIGAFVLSCANTMILNYPIANLLFVLDIVGMVTLGIASLRYQFSKYASFILIACNGLFMVGLLYSGIAYHEPIIHIHICTMIIVALLVLCIPQHILHNNIGNTDNTNVQ